MPSDRGERSLGFALQLLAARIIESAAVRWWTEAQALRGIEQATADREFADLMDREFPAGPLR